MGSHFIISRGHRIPASLHHHHHDARPCGLKESKEARGPIYGAQGMAWTEGSLTGVSRLSNQLASMFFISEDIRPMYPRRYEEGCVRTGVRRQVCSPTPPTLQPIPGRHRHSSSCGPPLSSLILGKPEGLGATASLQAVCTPMNLRRMLYLCCCLILPPRLPHHFHGFSHL